MNIAHSEKRADNLTPVGEPGDQTLCAIAQTLVDNLPDVQPHAIAEHEKRTEENAQLTDRDGTVFDQTVHKTGPDGRPTISKTGRFMRKPGAGRGVIDQSSSGMNKPQSIIGGVQNGNGGNSGATVSDSEAALLQARAAGKMAANLLLTLGVVAGGEEWQPLKRKESGLDEKEMLETAFADYFAATGKTDIPPGMALTVAVGAYALPRFTMPKTRTRMQKLGDWIKTKIANRKLAKHGLKVASVDNKKSATMEA